MNEDDSRVIKSDIAQKGIRSDSQTSNENLMNQTSEEEQKLRNALAGEYNVIRKLGAGGMASVYLAYEIALDRDVAIKVLPEEQELVPRHLARPADHAAAGVSGCQGAGRCRGEIVQLSPPRIRG